MKLYLIAMAALGAAAAIYGGANRWQVLASAAVAPVLLPVAVAHEARCYVEEWAAHG